MASLAFLFTLIYGILSIVGGIIGYKQAGSKVSLISGIVTGVLLLIGAAMMRSGNAAGQGLAIAVSLLLVIVFIVRLVKTRKFMPAGLMVAAGILTLISLLS